MYKLIDIVVEVQFTGVDPIGYDPTGYTGGTMVVTYNNGPRSLFKIRPSKASKVSLRTAVMSVARGKVLDAIEAIQRLKDGEPEWLVKAKQEAKRQKTLSR